MTYDSVVQELDGLIDSLDEHVTIEDVGVALGELRANVFERAKAEKAHTPTDDDRESGRLAIEGVLKACMLTFATSYEDAAGMAIDAVFDVLRRPVQGEPPADPYFDDGMIDPDICRECEEPESSCRCVQARTPEPQSEPTDAPTAQLLARKGGKTQALIDSMLAQANERGIRVEIVYPQGEPTDAEVEAARLAYVKSWGDPQLFRMRAALRAAAAVTEQGGENRG